ELAESAPTAVVPAKVCARTGAVMSDANKFNKDAFAGERIAPPSDEVMPDWPDKHVIKLVEGALASQIELSQKILREDDVFVHGNQLVRISESRELEGEPDENEI